MNTTKTESFDGYAMYPRDISLLLERLGAEFPEEMGALDTAIMDQCKTIMRENKAHWERFGIHGGAEAPAPLDANSVLSGGASDK